MAQPPARDKKKKKKKRRDRMDGLGANAIYVPETRHWHGNLEILDRDASPARPQMSSAGSPDRVTGPVGRGRAAIRPAWQTVVQEPACAAEVPRGRGRRPTFGATMSFQHSRRDSRSPRSCSRRLSRMDATIWSPCRSQSLRDDPAMEAATARVPTGRQADARQPTFDERVVERAAQLLADRVMGGEVAVAADRPQQSDGVPSGRAVAFVPAAAAATERMLTPQRVPRPSSAMEAPSRSPRGRRARPPPSSRRRSLSMQTPPAVLASSYVAPSSSSARRGLGHASDARSPSRQQGSRTMRRQQWWSRHGEGRR
jgi:hypothetical protein